MSRENVELVRRIYYEGLFDGDPARLLGLMGPDVEYVNPPEAVDPGVRRGREEVAKALAALRDFEWTSNDLHELFDADDTVVARVTFQARGRASDQPLAQEEAHTWTIRDGRIVRLEWGRDLSAALEAAGLAGEENLETVRRTVQAINERRFDAAAGEWDPAGEWRPAIAGAVEGRVYRGKAALRRYFDDVLENFSELQMVDPELRDLGGRVLVLYRLRVRGQDSGVIVDEPGGIVYELRDGKIVFGQSYLSREEALEAVGLSD
jgi:ketosteroid isomerase-like protein